MVELTQKDYEAIPKIQVEDVEYSNVMFFHNTIHYIVGNISFEDYQAYRKLLEDNGYKQLDADDIGIGKAFYTSVYQKDGREFTMMYYVPVKKIWVGLSQDEYRATWTGEEVFRDIPTMKANSHAFGNVEDYGAGNYVVEIEYTTKRDYANYLVRLEENGFVKHAENTEGINREVFCANYEKDNLFVTVTYLERVKKTFVSATFNQSYSEHLLYDPSYVENNVEGAKTQLHFLNLRDGGNGLIWKLKNGHFVLSDCGLPGDIDMVFDYLEKETPKGEKPVIEGWFISHGHVDHCGVFEQIASKPEEYANRVYLNGVYYSEPKELVFALDGLGQGPTILVKDALKFMKTTKGTEPVIYRTHMGERYYFNDITVDIVMAQEQLSYGYYCGDMNDSSTWCMFNVEGQKCLFGGDGDRGGMRVIVGAYEREYMKVDLFTLLHHGYGTKKWFTDHCEIDTMLVTVTGRREDVPNKEANDYQKAKCKEWLTSADGTKVFTFPYELGTYQCLE